MGYLIAISMLFFNIVESFKKKKIKLISIFCILIFILIYGANNYNPDYFNYLDMYNQVKAVGIGTSRGRDIGYKLLMYVAIKLGFQFQTFLIILSVLCFLVLSEIIKKYSYNNNYVYLLYFIYPFLLDVVQVRNFLLMCIVTYSVHILVEEKKHSKIRFLILMLLALTIHSSAILYFPLILIKLEKKDIVIKVMTIYMLLFCLVMIINGNRIPFIQEIISLFTDNLYVISWFENATNFGYLLFWAIHIFCFLLIKWSRKLIENRIEIKEHIDYKFINYTYWIIFVGFIWFPFYMVSIEFTRIIRNLFILIYIAFTITNRYLLKEDFQIKILYNLIVVSFVIFLFIIQIYIPHYNAVFKTVLENNLFW